jgi:hypothetical protein
MLSKVTWKCVKGEHAAFKAVIAKALCGQWCPACWRERRRPPKPAISIERILEVVRERGAVRFSVSERMEFGGAVRHGL